MNEELVVSKYSGRDTYFFDSKGRISVESGGGFVQIYDFFDGEAVFVAGYNVNEVANIYWN